MNDPNFIEIIGEEPLERVELIEYYKTFIPDSNTYIASTGKSYIVDVDNENKKLKVVSPITTNPIQRPEFLIFLLNQMAW